ncbi:T9SS type A sorting domain-containing protein (plasmid) [Flammeovirga sp. MY04]|nr:T9SS type A sorting domain-containing protein [Flammeovirga sp. MY04]ANQ52888.1 T9SS type A sorting domain-containing protein [Flammeovirga sp. MY04]
MFVLSINTSAQVVYKPKLASGYNSLSQWENPNNWESTNKNGYPGKNGANDIIEFGTIGWGVKPLIINFDLGKKTENVKIRSVSYNSILTLKRSAKAVFKSIEENAKISILSEKGSFLRIKEKTTFKKVPTSVEVSGTIIFESDLTSVQTQQFTVNQHGVLIVDGDFSASGANISIEEKGIFEIKGQFSVKKTNGAASLSKIDGALLIHKGIDINCNYPLYYSVGKKGGIYVGLGNGKKPSGGWCDAGNFNYCYRKAFCRDVINGKYSKNPIPNTVQLPVTLTYFKGEKYGDEVYLKWETATELNSRNFVVEASNDRKKWESITELQAQGNSDVSVSYDVTISGKYMYYRLVQYDFDGTSEKLGVLEFNDSELYINVYPTLMTPGKDINVSFYENELDYLSYSIIDIQGGLIKDDVISIQNGVQTIRIGIPTNTPSGIYILNINSGSRKYSTKFMIN